LAKMFKSAKYYFCNKSATPNIIKTRNKYTHADRELLSLMDAHVRTVYELPPKIGFQMFCKEYEKPENDSKLKKMYKNRYFKIVRS